MLIIEKVKEVEARYHYINRTAEEHLSVEQLKKMINDKDFENRATIPNNFPQTISNSSLARKAIMMFKDEYLLDFINVEEIGERDKSYIDERVVEKQIVENVKKFIMTFGKDFAFVGNQYHLEVYGENFFPDLLFFNRNLNALVVFELKTGDFKPIYLSQLMTYLRILDDKVRKTHENPSIGIVLCKNANKDFVKYVIQDYDKPMGVATFDTLSEMPDELRNALPNVEELKKLL
jgi:predicted nuclease of restriction endonuclease-like (RecB) superfamily